MKTETHILKDKTVYILRPDKGKEFLPFDDFETDDEFIRIVEVICSKTTS